MMMAWRRRVHLEDHVGFLPDGDGIGQYCGAGRLVGRIAVEGPIACPRLNMDLYALLPQASDGVRVEGHTSLPLYGLLDHSHNHRTVLIGLPGTSRLGAQKVR